MTDSSLPQPDDSVLPDAPGEGAEADDLTSLPDLGPQPATDSDEGEDPGIERPDPCDIDYSQINEPTQS